MMKTLQMAVVVVAVVVVAVVAVAGLLLLSLPLIALNLSCFYAMLLSASLAIDCKQLMGLFGRHAVLVLGGFRHDAMVAGGLRRVRLRRVFCAGMRAKIKSPTCAWSVTDRRPAERERRGRVEAKPSYSSYSST